MSIVVIGEPFYKSGKPCYKSGRPKRYVLAKCNECGKEWYARWDTRNKIKSCGCKREGSGRPTHGHTIGKQTPEYKAWNGMRERCGNKNNPGYHNYGGRGINVCGRWAKSFEAFFEDMGPRPSGTSIDRINNDGNYEPGNCRWATRKEQNRNKRNPRKIVINGIERLLAEVAEEVGISYKILNNRIARYGWTIERALLEPVKPKPKRLMTIYGKTMCLADWHRIVQDSVSYDAIKYRLRQGWTEKQAIFGK